MYVGVWVGMGARSNICVFVYTCVCQYICTDGEMCECMHACIFYVRAHEGEEDEDRCIQMYAGNAWR